MKRRFGILLLVLLAFFALASGVQADAELDGVYVEAAAGQEAPAVVRAQTADGEDWLFLPASTDLSALALFFDGEAAELGADGGSLDIRSGEAFDLTQLFPDAPDDGVYAAELRQDGRALSLRIMVSANTASMFLTSDDPLSKGREWIELSKSNKTSGQVCMLSPDGEVIYAGGMKQIKGRGNSTWLFPKRPYQIKLSASADLMENGESAGTWVLLANYCDQSLLHNSFTYDLAEELDMAYTPHGRPVDLYYDGEYRGSYLLSEKTEVKSNRVEVQDLEKAIEEANPDVADFGALPAVSGVTPAGNPCQYVSGLVLPGDWSGGYLLELDYADRAMEEASWFSSSLGQYVTVKSPEYLPKEAMDYISSCWQELTDALAAGGVNPETGKSYGEYVDVTSLARVYLIEELSHDIDSFRSSCFFYKDAGEGLIYAGPVWDFDSCYENDNLGIGTSGLSAGHTILGRLLLVIPSFREEVQRCWTREMYPLLREYVSGQGGRSISASGAGLAASQRMDAVLWPDAAPEDYGAAVEAFRSYVGNRAEWLNEAITSLTADTIISFLFVDVDKDSWYYDAVSYTVERGLFSGTSEVSFEPASVMSRAMALAVLHRLAGSPAPGGASGFLDVDEGAWYSGAAAWARSNGIIDGFDGGYFHPGYTVSRQELVTFLYRYARSRGADMTTAPISGVYTDIGGIDAAAGEAFAWAIHHGLIVGTSTDTLSPRSSVPRSQAAVIFQRFDLFLGE